jgi:Arc/MetJ-type ribon-helix-helix transcriptional regulator
VKENIKPNAMPRFTVSIDDELNDHLDELDESGEFDSKSSAARALLEQGKRVREMDRPLDEIVAQAEQVEELDRSLDELREAADRAEDLETENERLQRKLTETNARREEHQELVRYVEDEITYRNASLSQRAKWWLFGKDEG